MNIEECAACCFFPRCTYQESAFSIGTGLGAFFLDFFVVGIQSPTNQPTNRTDTPPPEGTKKKY